MPRKYRIVVLPGDGVGKEVIPEAAKILKTTENTAGGLHLEFQQFDCGAEYWLKTGKKAEWPSEAFEACKKADAILLGAVGLPNALRADGAPVGGDVVFGLRFGLDLFANVRPVKLYEGVPCPIAGKKAGDVDFVVVRENTEGMYAPIHGSLSRGERNELAVDVRVITEKGAERVVKYAFELCKKRKGAPIDEKRRVTCVDKSNVLQGCVLFRSIYDKIAKNYPRIEKDYAYIDAFMQWLIRKPEFYDVVVTSNMFGDIISELAAAIAGGVGLAAAGNIGDMHAMFEPIHGSAPRIAGQNKANPIGAILAGKMMLEWLSKTRNDAALKKAAGKIEKAVAMVLRARKTVTYDLGGNASTEMVGNAIVRLLTKV
ncbi:MAG: isocitrate/isopropylmalate dehydrogenase family protein [Candidatus Bathyarchaeia archaeon]|jgi:3-isopropylmalate dehydrogenase|nr:isocitrate/isopropylmalate dehydrogenase family protein [Candidatus Bathyarchaeota archaeon A05DMB-4]MDH7594803.1 isocitrate/isopropylmalate dehydrogenase family protein [Candidatus Bathyarchaeota archaeon]